MTTIELIEQFFGARFDCNPEGLVSTTEWCELLHFDGFVYWCVVLIGKEQRLWIMADKDPVSGHPVLELYAYFAGATLECDEASSMRILKIRPNNTDHEGRFLWFTRYGEGRISFGTSFGDEPASD